MPSRRCSIGCESWPESKVYTFCPICGEPTRLIRNEPTVTNEEARSVVLHNLFEEFYEQRCAQLGIPAHGPLPATELVA